MSDFKEFKKYQLKSFLIIIAVIFISESLIMLLLSYIDIHSETIEMLLDSILLTITTAPFIYYFLIRKLLIQKKSLIIDLERQIDSLNVAALVSETDVNGVITKVNEQFCLLSGYSENQLIGSSYNTVSSMFHSKEFWQNMWEKINKGEIWKGEICNKNKKGELYWLETTIFPKKDIFGNLNGFSTVKINITERVVRQNKLKLATKTAGELVESKSLFLANMSHEIRTPMNGVIAMTEMLNASDLSHEQREMTSTIKSCGDNLMVIINDILDLSKIEAGKLTLEKENFQLNQFIDNLIFLFSAVASKNNITLEKNIASDVPPYFIGDDTRIMQILSNFLSNAIKFTGEKGLVKLTVGHSLINETHSLVEINVTDNGIGIKPEAQKLLFEAFTQADISTTRKFGGTGLGLAICSKLTELMAGEILLESKLGEGTSITLTIPLEHGHNVLLINECEEKINNFEDHEFASYYPHKILLVEDNAINQKIAKMIFNKLGYKCEVASDGLEAVEMVVNNKTCPYSLIFMDIMMPEMDGVTATKKIFEILGENSPIIIAMTANVFEEDKKKFTSAGMNDFIAKPVQISEFKRVLTKYSN